MDFLRQLAVGAGSIFLVPVGLLPRPQFTVTVPSGTATEAIAGDFARISGDLRRATKKVEEARQLEFRNIVLESSAEPA